MQQSVLRVGAFCAIVGALLALLLNVVHPDMPFGMNETRVIIASRADWRTIHFGIIISALLLTYAFTALTISLTPKSPFGFQWFGIVTTVVAAAVVMVAIGVDGFADKTLSDLWSHSTSAGRPPLRAAGYAIYLVHEGLFYIWAGLFFGVAYVFYGAALAQSEMYPKLFGQIGTIIGGAEALIGAAQYLVLNDALEVALRVVLLAATLWLFVLGALMWRNAGRCYSTEIASGIASAS